MLGWFTELGDAAASFGAGPTRGAVAGSVAARLVETDRTSAAAVRSRSIPVTVFGTFDCFFCFFSRMIFIEKYDDRNRYAGKKKE